ncbi:uncharacterized protein F5891DRAFT_1192457 [Suillus fuscotomentosus]|uniref:Uncharacterized protein n=1 Tax=Suillus fuscotomentosus TaxID=1912939 RepID=A0AAD4DZW6_9AGAM|nr:uncharacterized protein F5891DRAFT_1192457 [Suillus fuscotomentosus]KAG1897037.1 hypothetical protein F5891DRAFT_1192457 [Suillus fuscotomentosus]
MSSSSLKFNIATLRSLSALASCPDDSSRSNNEYNEGAPCGICDLYEILEAVNSIPGVHEPTNTEASLVLDLARAKRDVFLTQKELADCVIRENEVFASLLRVRAAAAEKMIDQTDIGLGCMRVVFRDHGWSHIPPSRPSQEQGPSSLRGLHGRRSGIILD